jgi:hypothetical protein
MPFGGPQSRRFYLRCMVVCAAGLVLCVATAFVILYLQSPRVGMVRPWFDEALNALKAFLLFFSLATLVFKYFAQLSEGPGDSSE